MTFYQELQLNQAGSKKLIKNSKTSKEKFSHTAVYLFKIALTVAFCFFFVTFFSKIFGSENSVAGVAILLSLLAFRQVDLGFDVGQSSYVMMGMYVILIFGPHLANAFGPGVGFVINLACMLAMTVFGCYEIRFFNHATLLLSYILLYGNDVTGDLYLKRVIGLALGGLWIVFCLYRNHMHKNHKDTLRDVMEAFSINASETRWHIKVSLGISLAILIGELMGLPRTMWIGIAAMSVIHPSNELRKRSHMFYRLAGNVLGCVLFLGLLVILPKSMYGLVGVIGGIGVGFCASYKWQTVFNSFGALGLAMAIFGLKTAIILRILNNAIAVGFVFIYVPLFDKILELVTQTTVSKELLS